MENNTTTRTRQAIVDDVDNLKKGATQIVEDVKAHAHAHVDETKQRLQDAVTATQARIAAHPFAILGLGMLLGYIFGARRRRYRA